MSKGRREFELESWIAHRERRTDLPRQLALLLAELYRMPAGRFAEHGLARSDAMTLRDSRCGNITDSDWAAIEKLLRTSWQLAWSGPIASV